MSLKLILLGSIGLLGLFASWLCIFQNWRRGVIAFLLYTPISGAIELWLFPSPWPVLFKDICFAVPLYLAFFLSGEGATACRNVPRSIATILSLFVLLVIAQMLNPFNSNLVGLLAPLIGAKVWLFYVPMLLVGMQYIDSAQRLLTLSRLLLCLAWIPCVVGLLQYALSQTIGYERTMTMFYGDAALAATQQFTTFAVGLKRIPSTFSFVAQYLSFILCMLVPALGLRSLESVARWRQMRTGTVWLLCVAGALCGARAAFVMIPLLLGIFYFCKGGFVALLLPALLLATSLYVVLTIAGIDISGLADLEGSLVSHYSVESQTSFIDATASSALLGEGVGSNTNEAQRFVKEESIRGVENYYAKIVFELGIVGLVIVPLAQLSLIRFGIRSHLKLTNRELKPYSDAITSLLILIFIYDAKGQAIDFDPLNMFYWFFGGIMLRLPSLSDVGAENLIPKFCEAPASGKAY